MTRPVSQPASSPATAVIAIISKFMILPPRQRGPLPALTLADVVRASHWTLV
jgi:hypothetical protein